MEGVVVPRTAEELMELPREAFGLSRQLYLAAQRGARIVDWEHIRHNYKWRTFFCGISVAVTTGNSYTVVSAVEAILEALQKLNVKWSIHLLLLSEPQEQLANVLHFEGHRSEV